MEQSQVGPQPAVSGRAVLRDEYDIDKLAPEHKRLLDQAQALPGDVGFFPTKPSWLKLIGALVAVFLLALCGICAIIGNFTLVGGPTTVYDQTGSFLITVGGVFLIASLAAIFIARAQYRQLNSQASGQVARYGLFLAPDAILLRNSLGYTLVPRERIVTTRMEGTEAQVVYRNNEGKDQNLTLSQPLGGLNGPQLLAAVRQWLGVPEG
jgi:hypothetical protein